jgi:hypothetical protein
VIGAYKQARMALPLQRVALAVSWLSWALSYVSPRESSSAPGVFYTYFYKHAHRPRLEKLLYLEPSRSPSGCFKQLLDPGGGFRSETAVT